MSVTSSATSPRRTKDVTSLNVNDITPRTAIEQYWAARALTAEALLKARTDHHKEMRAMSYSEDMKRERERSNLMRANEDKLLRMEKLLWALFATIALLCLLVVYMGLRYNEPKPKHHHWLLPSHFTIPILSPFTSVVEHETSALGAKVIIPSVMVSALLFYAVYRHWIVAYLQRQKS
ncbi:hypothetical protein CYLTODRAFT_346084 [Cylindrobasidium torrendii FP15055 ss-10]|uniref:Uncharacterized protein n=1 Tax=Cylindrobasidium torrendii FP15055 ss-10 TaxID=1314674 RepID=A0A0D7BMA2_9AGAR|nr:hypothetical protein CYLTODRAFT_346084 [Cylindrobasidium torrendii FP15055 ss-10]